MLQLALAAHIRENKGKGAARKLRQNNQLPAIFYGPKTQPIMLTVDYRELTRITKQGKGENIILDLQIKSDHGEESRKAMLKDLMVDPVNGACLHADFYEISMDKEITVDVPVTLVNTPIGVTQGGFLQHVKRDVTISCLPDSLIDSLNIDVSGMKMGDTLHIRDIEFPEGIRCAEEGYLTVAVVSAPGGGVGVEKGPEEGVEAETAVSEKETAGE